MRIAHPKVIMPDHPVMKKAMKVAERIWKAHDRAEGITVTAGKDGVHSAGSWHYYGAAGDLRTNYVDKMYWEADNYHDYPPESEIWSPAEKREVYDELKGALPGYDICWHDSHIHMEPGDSLAKKWGLLI